MSSCSHWYNSIFHTLHAPRPPWRIHNPRAQPRPPRASFFPGSPSPSSRVTWLGAEVSYGVKASKPGYSITRVWYDGSDECWRRNIWIQIMRVLSNYHHNAILPYRCMFDKKIAWVAITQLPVNTVVCKIHVWVNAAESIWNASLVHHVMIYDVTVSTVAMIGHFLWNHS